MPKCLWVTETWDTNAREGSLRQINECSIVIGIFWVRGICLPIAMGFRGRQASEGALRNADPPMRCSNQRSQFHEDGYICILFKSGVQVTKLVPPRLPDVGPSTDPARGV